MRVIVEPVSRGEGVDNGGGAGHVTNTHTVSATDMMLSL